MKLRVQLTEGRLVRDPETGKKLEKGVVYEVKDSVFWRRRLQSKDVFDVDGQKKAAAKTQKAEKGKKSETPESVTAEASAPQPTDTDVLSAPASASNEQKAEKGKK